MTARVLTMLGSVVVFVVGLVLGVQMLIAKPPQAPKAATYEPQVGGRGLPHEAPAHGSDRVDQQEERHGIDAVLAVQFAVGGEPAVTVSEHLRTTTWDPERLVSVGSSPR